MPSQRLPGTKLAGAYISADKDKALAEIAALKGYANKAEFIRFLFDEAISENAHLLKKRFDRLERSNLRHECLIIYERGRPNERHRSRRRASPKRV